MIDLVYEYSVFRSTFEFDISEHNLKAPAIEPTGAVLCVDLVLYSDDRLCIT